MELQRIPGRIMKISCFHMDKPYNYCYAVWWSFFVNTLLLEIMKLRTIFIMQIFFFLIVFYVHNYSNLKLLIICTTTYIDSPMPALHFKISSLFRTHTWHVYLCLWIHLNGGSTQLTSLQNWWKVDLNSKCVGFSLPCLCSRQDILSFTQKREKKF